MIIYETKVRTRLELKLFLSKLERAGFRWRSGSSPLEYHMIVDSLPAWIEITDEKKIVWGVRPVPKERWYRF